MDNFHIDYCIKMTNNTVSATSKKGLQAIIQHYVLHPLKLIMQNRSIFLLFLVVILVNHFSGGTSRPQNFVSPEWLYDLLPKLVISVIKSPVWITLIVLALVVKAVLTVIVAEDMMLIYRRARISLLNSLRKITFDKFAWYLTADVLINATFGLIALLFYLPISWLWHVYHSNLTPVLAGAFLVLYPVFYFSLTTTSMVAVLPLNTKDKLQKLKYLLTLSRLAKLYGFYVGRLLVEALLLFVGPYFAVSVFKSRELAFVLAALGLMVPFTLLGASAYELKLDLFENDLDFRRLFSIHYSETRQEQAV